MGKDYTSWYEDLTALFESIGDSWENVESNTLNEHDLHRKFHHRFGGLEGSPFTVWTKTRVYFPIVYDGSEWVGFVPRHPNGEPMEHQGGQ